MQFRFRCAAVLTAVLLCSAAALPALAEETATPETADSVSTYTGWKTVNGKDYWYENGVKQGTTGRGKEIYDPDSDAWYWLDADQGGAKAVSKDGIPTMTVPITLTLSPVPWPRAILWWTTCPAALIPPPALAAT